MLQMETPDEAGNIVQLCSGFQRKYIEMLQDQNLRLALAGETRCGRHDPRALISDQIPTIM